MGHVAQNIASIADDLVRALALDMADEADTTHGGDGGMGLGRSTSQRCGSDRCVMAATDRAGGDLDRGGYDCKV
jgi:hypothetical protein